MNACQARRLVCLFAIVEYYTPLTLSLQLELDHWHADQHFARGLNTAVKINVKDSIKNLFFRTRSATLLTSIHNNEKNGIVDGFIYYDYLAQYSLHEIKYGIGLRDVVFDVGIGSSIAWTARQTQDGLRRMMHVFLIRRLYHEVQKRGEDEDSDGRHIS